MVNIIESIEKMMPEKKIDVFGKGGLLLTSLPYYSFVIILLLAQLTIWDNPWFLIALVYGFLPLLDEVFIKDYRNPNEEERKQLERDDPYFRVCLYVTVTLDWLMFIEMMQFMSSYSIEKQGFLNLIGTFYVYANLSATQFTLAH